MGEIVKKLLLFKILWTKYMWFRNRNYYYECYLYCDLRTEAHHYEANKW